MINGTVTACEPRLRLKVLNPRGPEHDLQAVMDSGFTGFLTLPPPLAKLVGHRRLHRERVKLADGTTKSFDVYEVTVMWDGQVRRGEALAMDAEVLIGMTLLEGYEVRMQVIEGGNLVITRLKP
jgi:clan AA aspartic protease